jgi:ADP-ribosylglycohydrolase
VTEPSPERIAAAMHAFAAGDALGVPWEGRRPDEIDRAAITAFPPLRDGWARGETSDDTDQMLLVAELLVDTGGDPTASLFMERLAAAGDAIRGIGPSTRRALAHFGPRARCRLPRLIPRSGRPTAPPCGCCRLAW